MPTADVLVSELEPLEALLQTAAGVVLSIAAYLAAKLRLGWWRPPRLRQ